MANRVFTCCFCGQPLDTKEANNAEPVIKNGKCCGDCNMKYVIPVRLAQMAKHGKGTVMKLKQFIKKVDLTKFPNITIMDKYETIDCDDVVKNGVLREKPFKLVEDLQVEPDENPDNLKIGIYDTYVIHCVVDDDDM